MSWEATAYVKGLLACPDDARLSRGQKLLAIILADYHNTHHRAAWPSVPTIAREALTSHSQAKRDLQYLEDHLLLRKIRPEKFGRGWQCAYEFLQLDAKEAFASALAERAKRVHGEPLFYPDESRPEGVHFDTQMGPEIVQKGSKASDAIRKNIEPEQILNEEHHAAGALRTWIEVKRDLKSLLPAEEYQLWVEAAKLLCPMSETQLLVALPPNRRIIDAVQSHKQLLAELLGKRGLGISLTRYPDRYEMERLRREHPDFYAQFFPAMREAHEERCEAVS